MIEQTAIPATLYLPDGSAELLPGMAVYLRDGLPIDVDVTIPDDLLETGWFWWGSTLCLDERGGLICIGTGTYPPPGAAHDRDDCFTVARSYAAKRAELQVATQSKPVTKRRSPSPPSSQAEAHEAPVEQLAMELAL